MSPIRFIVIGLNLILIIIEIFVNLFGLGVFNFSFSVLLLKLSFNTWSYLLFFHPLFFHLKIEMFILIIIILIFQFRYFATLFLTARESLCFWSNNKIMIRKSLIDNFTPFITSGEGFLCLYSFANCFNFLNTCYSNNVFISIPLLSVMSFIFIY